MPENFENAQNKAIEEQDLHVVDKKEYKHPTGIDPLLNPQVQKERLAEHIESEAKIQNSLDKLGASRLLKHEAPKEEPHELTSGEVKTKEDFRTAMMMMKTIFTDPTDLETNWRFSQLFFSPEQARYYLFRDGNKPIGTELIRINPHVEHAIYTPYAGVAEDYRNMGIYPKAAEISDEQMRSWGKDHVLYEFEDPTRMQGVYPDEKLEDVVARAEGRINFWRRSVDCAVVNDADVPYCRPSSKDPKGEVALAAGKSKEDAIKAAKQAYDVLAFRVLDKNDAKWQKAFNEQRTAISREAYEQFYLEIMQLEYGTSEKVPTRDELRAEYPAIDQFFKQLEAHPDKKWISLETKPIRTKATETDPRPMFPEEPDDRGRWKHTPAEGPGWDDQLHREAA